jgi:hypothetical protein
MLMLGNGKDLLLGQATERNAVFQRNHQRTASFCSHRGYKVEINGCLCIGGRRT